MKPFQRLSCLLLAALAACASSGSDSSGHGANVLVVLHDYKNGQRFELASETHTDRVAYYSSERGDAVRKIQPDEVMAACVGELERRGYDAHSKDGRAPSIGANDVVRWGLEVENEGQRSNWLVGTGSAADEWKDFQACRDFFLEVYNNTVSYQTVRNATGKQYFEDERAQPGARKP